MKIKITQIMVLFLALAPLSLFAQSTYTFQDYASIGDTITVRRDTTRPVVNPGPAGANQNWSFSNFTASEQVFLEFTANSGLPASSSFPNSNLVLKIGDSDFFLRKTQDSLLAEGIFGTLNGITGTIAFDKPINQFKFPSTFNTSFNSNTSWKLGLTGAQVGQSSVDSVEITVFTQRSSTVDGHGNLNVMGSQFDEVLREKRIDYNRTLVRIKVPFLGWQNGFPAFGIPYETLDTTYNYLWWTPNHIIPVLEVNLNSRDTATGISWYRLPTSDPCDGIAATGSITGEQNPIAGSTHTYSVTGSAGSSFAWSITGGTINGSSSGSSIEVTWGSEGAGTLSVTETHANSCAGAPVTLSLNIGPLSTSEMLALSLRVYPNPASSHLTINASLPSTGNWSLKLYDNTGKLILVKGLAAQSTSTDLNETIDISELASGTYLLSIEGKGIRHSQLVIKH
jgi:hypothetical protein